MELLEQLGAALGDRYRVERELGHGGMAVVFLAQDLKHRRPVAIKLLKAELSAMLGSERFLREIEIAATLQHPHILPLFDSGQVLLEHPEPFDSAQGRLREGSHSLLYYVMPFVEGESLRQRLDREQQLPIGAALQITREVGSALQYAHAHGVIHRDIKPENIMLSGGQAVVADFGIARALDAANADQLTLTGMVVGTPRYMSPEQAVGAAVDGRSDQYSLACMLYEMLIGQPPFTGPSANAILARHSLDPVPSLRVVRQTVSPAVETAIMRAMAKVPADRFSSVQEFLDALESPEIGADRTALAGTAGSRSGRQVSRWVFAAMGGGVMATAAAWWFVAGHRGGGTLAGSDAVTALAVLPFQELGGKADSSYLGEGVTEGLVADLAQIGALKVITRSSGAVAQGSTRSLTELARELGVEGVVKGSIQRVGDTVRVNVRFVHAPDSTLLFARDYQTTLGELPDLQREITLAISRSISAKLKGTERSRLAARSPVDQRGYDAYLRGRFHLERGELDQAKLFFDQAIRTAPDWAPPYVGLANYYTSLPFFTDVAPAEVLPKARTALAQALQLDETLAEAHAANAYIRAYYEWDWRTAEQEFRRALELRPNYADAYFSYGRFLASRRRLDEAIAQLGRAVELDPLSPSLMANRALLDYFAGRYEEAEKRLREVLKTDSTDVTAKWGLALVAEQQGRLPEAIALLEPLSANSLNRKSSLGHAYAVAGRGARARSILTSFRAATAQAYVPAYYFALVYTGLGERDQAFRYLERAYEERSTVLAYLLIDPRLAPLRNDSRFQALARRLQEE